MVLHVAQMTEINETSLFVLIGLRHAMRLRVLCLNICQVCICCENSMNFSCIAGLSCCVADEALSLALLKLLASAIRYHAVHDMLRM